MDTTAPTAADNYECDFTGCGRRFKRQEHLTRHQRSHDPANIFACEICQKTFNRKDSLNRHLSLHADVLTLPSSKKTKRACVACRRGKNKCDGEARCSTCVKRDIECHYESKNDAEDEHISPAAEDVQMGGTSDGVSPESITHSDQHASSSVRSGHTFHSPASLHSEVSSAATSQSPVSIDQSRTQQPQRPKQPPPIPPTLEQRKIINWMATRVIKQDPVTPKTNDEPKYEIYIQEFFDSIHLRWELIHRPTYRETSADPLIVYSMRMMGAWVVGTNDSKSYALATHEACVNAIIPKLHQVTCHDDFWQVLTANFCFAALFNIIFPFYTGDEKKISRAAILLNTLVAALREVGFFDEDTAWPDEKPNLFPPMRMGALGQRQRLAAYLFKADAYISILRHKPPSIASADLHFALPTTFSLYNSNGLDVWEERQMSEPSYRSQTTMFRMITEKLNNLDHNEPHPMLLEDIQMCLAATWSRLWNTSQMRRMLATCGPVLDPEKVAIQRQLDSLKSRLDLIKSQIWGTTPYGQEPYLSLRYYTGREDPSLPNAAHIATTRMNDLLTDSLMLYHLLSILITTDVALLLRILKDQTLSPVEEASQVQAHERQNRLFQVKACWGGTSLARSALSHCVDILLVASRQNPNRQAHTQDPISHIALTFASVVVFIYAMYGTCACELCLPNPELPVFELARPETEESAREKAAWVEVGAELRPQIEGVQLCICNCAYLTAVFKAYLPLGWEVGSIIPDGPGKPPPDAR